MNGPWSQAYVAHAGVSFAQFTAVRTPTLGRATRAVSFGWTAAFGPRRLRAALSPLAHSVPPGGQGFALDLVPCELAVLGKHCVLVDALHMPVSCDAWPVFAVPECLARFALERTSLCLHCKTFEDE